MTSTVPSWKTCAIFAAAMLAGSIGADEASAAVPAERATTRRSTAEGNLTDDDRLRFRELGLARPHSAVVIVRHIPRSAGVGQQARLESLARAPEGLAPSGACDELLGQGEANALCRGHVRGPFGNVAARMPIAATLQAGASGTLRLTLTNSRALEVRSLASWSSVVAPEHVVLAYELVPRPDGWLVQVRVGVEMSDHEDSAKAISDCMLKLESWLTRELIKA